MFQEVQFCYKNRFLNYKHVFQGSFSIKFINFFCYNINIRFPEISQFMFIRRWINQKILGPLLSLVGKAKPKRHIFLLKLSHCTRMFLAYFRFLKNITSFQAFVICFTFTIPVLYYCNKLSPNSNQLRVFATI